MSHVTGTLQPVNPFIGIGPDYGNNAHNLTPIPAPVPTTPPGGIKFVMLHFTNASLPASNRLEVDLGYGMDVFTAADGPDFWTRPINVRAFADGRVPISYITDGAANGGVRLVGYGRGERQTKDPGPDYTSPLYDCYTNCDPFLIDGNYTEPQYAHRWYCNTPGNLPPNWENIGCFPEADIRRQVARSVCMLVMVHGDHVSTCTGTLIAPDLVISAGHCVTSPNTEVPTASVIFDYETGCGGEKPVGYNPVVCKVLRHVKYGTLAGSSTDYILLQIKTPPEGLGIPVIPFRNSLPAIGEQVFGVHHPNGAVKKISRRHTEYATVFSNSPYVSVSLDVAGGSSGSGLFDTAGRFLGVLSNGPACELGYAPTPTILRDIANHPVLSPARDVMIVFDRSGSMAMAAGTGRSKIEEAQDAASLFVQLVRSDMGNRVGLVTFSTTAANPVEDSLSNVTAAHKTTLIGPSPFVGGIVGSIVPDNMTSIGDGLQAGRAQLPAPGSTPNRPTILLLTDGLQNTPPMIEDVDASLSGVDVHAIGFGTESSLNGGLLTHLAQTHNGLYMRAGDGLALKKFFALSFGNIFEAGTLLDPEFFLKASDQAARPVPFTICEEAEFTVVLGWDKESAPLYLWLTTPGGQIVNSSTAGVTASYGRTWAFMRVALPVLGEQSGLWNIYVARPGLGEEFPAEGIDVRYFLNVVAKDGPTFRLRNSQKVYYTGEPYNPLVTLVKSDGFPPHDAVVRVTVTKPATSIGSLLAQSGLQQSIDVDGDTLPARYRTLQQLEQVSGAPTISFVEETFELYDNSIHEAGAMEPDGIFGHILPDLFKHEGNYTFHAVANYGHDCVGRRELNWSVYVDTGIDPGQSVSTSTVIGNQPDGKQVIEVDFTPRDRFSNPLGPGRLDGFTLTRPGGSVVNEIRDNNDGTYSTTVVHDPAMGSFPGFTLGQEGRNSITVGQVAPIQPDASKWKCLFWVVLLMLIITLIVLAVIVF
ncbi:MAG: trypsin-like peptidase domain-containing protein [Phycisphaerae bacterium]|nr:trypsin-like peptidase domain-containing protein [Saprospiraceae bacterium]